MMNSNDIHVVLHGITSPAEIEMSEALYHKLELITLKFPLLLY